MKVLDSVAIKLLPIANAIGQQRHLQAIRNGLISILPLTIVGFFHYYFKFADSWLYRMGRSLFTGT